MTDEPRRTEGQPHDRLFCPRCDGTGIEQATIEGIRMERHCDHSVASLGDIIRRCLDAGLDPYPIIADELRALGYTVTPPDVVGR